MDTSEPQNKPTPPQATRYPRLLDPTCPHNWISVGVNRAVCPDCGKVETVGDTLPAQVSIPHAPDETE